ncbi:MAG TPA: redoxin family protein [Gemmatales bacterium]|nr:redoxin family protein [Gemmatales bacterium]
MNRLMLATLAVALTCSIGLAQENKASNDTSFSTLKKEFEETNKKFWAERQKEMQAEQAAMKAKIKVAKDELENAKTDEEKAAAEKKLKEVQTAGMKAVKMTDGPAASFAPRFLALAEKNPKDPAALDSLTWAMQTSGGSTAKNGIYRQALKMIRSGFLDSSGIKKLFPMLAHSNDDDSIQVLRDVIAKHPDRKVQAKAAKALANGLENAVQQAKMIQNRPEVRKNYEEQVGKEVVEALLVNADRNKKEAAELTKLVQDKYSDVFPNLAIGQPAPEVINKDLDDKTVKLSDLKGRVVVLDIWATWCGPCRAMIPHEREMVEKLKDKPFTLVSISADEEKETLTNFLAKEKMPWTHWWSGKSGGILEDWDVQYFPTIYVIDAKGIIRHKDLRGAQLEKAVEELLTEAGK